MFKPQLARALTDKQAKKISKDIEAGHYVIQRKRDGNRAIFEVREDEVLAYSRNGKPFYNVDHIKEQVRDLFGVGAILDGELEAKDWNTTQEITRTKNREVNAESLNFHIFDIPSMIHKYKIRRDYLERELIHSIYGSGMPNLILVGECEIHSIEEAWDIARKFRDEPNGEGAIIKDVRDHYHNGRGGNWWKLKFTETLDLKLFYFEEGKGKHTGRLGSAWVYYKGKAVGVGTGFTDEERETFWKNRDNLKGKTIEVSFQSITKDGSLQFPKFIRIREDK